VLQSFVAPLRAETRELVVTMEGVEGSIVAFAVDVLNWLATGDSFSKAAILRLIAVEGGVTLPSDDVGDFNGWNVLLW
jgi:hypothetical protein